MMDFRIDERIEAQADEVDSAVDALAAVIDRLQSISSDVLFLDDESSVCESSAIDGVVKTLEALKDDLEEVWNELESIQYSEEVQSFT